MIVFQNRKRRAGRHPRGRVFLRYFSYRASPSVSLPSLFFYAFSIAMDCPPHSPTLAPDAQKLAVPAAASDGCDER